MPAHSLAVFRILFGALVFWDFWRFILHDRIWRYWIAPDFHFSYPGFAWVAPLPEPWIQLAWLALGASALLVMIGLAYRAAIVALTLLFGYFFLLDAAEYLNHFYLVVLFAILMCFLPAARVWSVDALLRPPARRTIPHAAIFILRAQMEIMLVFAGLVKLTPDWLAGEPLGLWLRAQAEGVWIEPLIRQDWVIVTACWAVIALHVLGAPLLIWRRTRLAVFLLYCAFHLANAFFFNIGIFPWLTIAATTLFFAPDWPLRLAGRLRGHAAPSTGRTAPRAPPRPLPRAALAAIAVWLAVQIALPLRAGFFASEVRWTGDGHRFSWRMRLFDREAEGRLIVTDRETGQQWTVDPAAFLTDRQADKMLVRPDLIHQFAGHLADLWRAEGHDVAVRADICKSLNGRPCQTYVDPTVDLTRARLGRLGRDPWVLPLELPVWGVADNALHRP